LLYFGSPPVFGFFSNRGPPGFMGGNFGDAGLFGRRDSDFAEVNCRK